MEPIIKHVQMPVLGQERAFLNRIRARAKKYKIDPSDVRTYTLILYSALKNDKNMITWRLDQEAGALPQEIRLEKSDTVFANKIALGIHKVNKVGGVEQPANHPIFFYPDTNYFTETDEALTLEALYNSKLSFKTDQDVRLENFSTQYLRHVPEQQYQAAATGVLQRWPNQKLDDAMYDIISNLGIWGNKRNEIILSIGDGDFGHVAGAAGDAGHQNYAVMFVKGIQIVNGAQSLTKSAANMLFAEM